ncbi:putative protein kinase RLK-Pelle-RLCK-VIIa-2 family [Helianthus annuus]|nr:putative protein kinase RLK-Pelle-RLCK-VIIa-2 family [Helianthus annuus]
MNLSACLLVYEHMPNKSLDLFLFPDTPNVAVPLSWRTRLLIMIGVARGLTYLHSANVIYRDVKSANILLDGDFNAKLADFGLARRGPETEGTHVSTCVVGTYGYAAPEYVQTGGSRITMPPRMRGRGGFATTHDHEAGPSHRRAPSATHNTAANDLWRSFAEPARHSVSASTSPSLPHSFGPHSENGPHGSHGSYIPLHQSPHQYPAPAYQGLYDPNAFADEPVGHNPLGPEDHFSGGHEMDVDEDTDPSLPPSGTPNHPIEISDGSPFRGSPYNGGDSFQERFKQHDWYFTPSHNSPMIQSHQVSPVHSQHHSQQLQQQPPLPQDLSEALWRDVITPSPPPPPVLPPPPQRPRRNARMSTRGGIRIGTPPRVSSSRYTSLPGESETGESQHPVSEVTSIPIPPLPPQNFGEPIPAYASAAQFNPFEHVFPQGYDYTGDPYWQAVNYSSLPPSGPLGDTWTAGQSTFGYPPGYQQPPQPQPYQPPQPQHYQPPPPAPMMSPPQVQEILHGIDSMRRELQNDRRHNRGMFKKVFDLLKGKSKRDH